MPFCHPYQVPSYLRASHSLSHRTAVSCLKPSSSSSSSDTLRSFHNFAWCSKPGSSGDCWAPIPTGCSQLLTRWQEAQQSVCYSLRGCRVTWKKNNKMERYSFRERRSNPRSNLTYRPPPHPSNSTCSASRQSAKPTAP